MSKRSVVLDVETDMVVQLPYGLTIHDLIAEEGDPDLRLELKWLMEHATEEELPRILLAAVLLHRFRENDLSFSRCLHTAIVWERG